MKKRYWIASICITAFLILLICVLTNHMEGFDQGIYQAVYSIRNNIIDTFFCNFTHIGDTVSVIIIVAILFFLFKKRKDKVLLIFTVATTVAFNQLLKHIIMRPRPPMERRLVKQGGYSFPSGHSMIALCICGLLIYFAVTRMKNKTWKIVSCILLTIICLLVGISRIYVGVHYPSDVLGGYLLTLPLLIGDITYINYHFKGE